MISILISGTLIKQPEARVSRNGNDFVTAQLRVGATDENFLVSVAAFDEQLCRALLALNKGDDLAVAGSGKPSGWTSKDGLPALGLSLVAKQIMTTYAVKQKRKAFDVGKKSYLPARSPLLDRAEDSDGAPF